MLDRVVDRLVVAELEVQEWVVFYRAPVPTRKRVAANEVDSTRDVPPGALRQHQQHLVGHRLADERVEFPREIRAAPFARAGLDVKSEEMVPDGLSQI